MATTTGEPLVKSRFSNEPNAVPGPRGRKKSGIGRWILALVVLAAVGGVAWAAKSGLKSLVGSGDEDKSKTEQVRRGELLISVLASGNLESAANVDAKCEVAGGSSIIWIVPDGSEVKKGDKVVELDSSAIKDQIDRQTTVVDRAVALKLQCEREYSAAKIAVQEYLDGTFLKEMQAAEAQITIAMENMRSAENAYQHTSRMARKGYVTPLQVDAQKFAVERAKLDLGTAETTKNVLEKFTKIKMLEDLESKRDSAEARMRAESKACETEANTLKKMQTQLEKCVISAPQDGMVIYANEYSGGRSGSNQTVKIEEGAAVRERQSIVRLPDLSKMQVKVTIHESKVDSLLRGMRAHIKVQDRVLQGEIVSIANQPEPSSYSSSSVKEYATIVRIDGEMADLKPGMTAEVEILIADLKDVIAVPVQAVVEQGDKFHCWVKAQQGNPERRPVLLGLSNSTSVEIKDGLADGDLVLLNPRAVVPEAREEVATKKDVDVKSKFGESKTPVGGAAAGPAVGAPTSAGARSGGGAGMPSFKDLDKNSDGKITVDEASERMRQNFDKLDTNTDGGIDPAEFAAMRKRIQQQREQGGGASGESQPAAGGAR